MLDKTYDPKEIEARLYPEWEGSGAFRAHPESQKPPYCIVIPPPNVTGSLHMGHALDNTLQDVLIRWRRMKGDDVLWQPGTDHAGIATQMVVVRNLEQEGIGLAVEGAETGDGNRKLLNREEFLAKVWEWKAYSGGTITSQLRRLGASCDWSRERFTMDEGLSRAVLKVFVDLYKAGLIYKDNRLVNWDPKMLTAISDLEVESREVKGSLWYFRYPIEGSDEHIVVATTRPETMLGDTGVAVHPDDPKWKHLIGKHAILPLVGRRIPIVADEYSDPEKGSGAVKITPAHDFNDFEVGRRHKLEAISVFDRFARLNDRAPEKYRGLDRFEARKTDRGRHGGAGPRREDRAAHPCRSLRRPRRRAGRAVPHRAVVRRRQEARRRRRSRRRATAGCGSCPSAGATTSSAGWRTSSPGASRASSGGATRSRPGTGRTDTCSWRCPRMRRRPRRGGTTARTSPSSAIPTCSTPGSARRCGRSRPWAGPTRPSSLRSTTRPACW